MHRLRVERGWTQVQLAKAAHLKERYVQIVETGEANLTLKAFVALADALDVDPADLFAAAKLPPRRIGRPPSTK